MFEFEKNLPSQRIEAPYALETVRAPRYFELLKKEDAAKVAETAKYNKFVEVHLTNIENEEDLQRLAETFNERYSAGFHVGVDRQYEQFESNVEVYSHYSAEMWSVIDNSLADYMLIEIVNSPDALGHMKDLGPLFGPIPSPKI